MKSSNEGKWTDVITSESSLLDFKLKEVLKYKDLLFMLIKRDFVSVYKQTILGPLWFLVQPVITSITFSIIFGNLAGISTDGLPKILFYMAGVTCWGYFASCLTQTSSVFRDNQAIFGKVYFPRLVVPLSIVISNLFKFAIQFLLFIVILFYFIIFENLNIDFNIASLLFPVLVFLLAGIALGFGLIVTSLTTKYRDLIFLLSFGIQLLMYLTPVIYPLSSLSDNVQSWMLLNPITPIIEAFKYGFLGKGVFDWGYLVYSFLFMVIIIVLGMIIFNKTEKNFMDTV